MLRSNSIITLLSCFILVDRFPSRTNAYDEEELQTQIHDFSEQLDEKQAELTHLENEYDDICRKSGLYAIEHQIAKLTDEVHEIEGEIEALRNQM